MFLAVARKFFLKRHPHTRFPYRHQEERRPSGPISRSFTETDTVKPTGSRKRSAQGVSEGSSPECRDAEAVPVYRRLHLPTPTDRGGPKSISCAHSPPAKALGVTAELGGLLAPSLRPKSPAPSPRPGRRPHLPTAYPPGEALAVALGGLRPKDAGR